ncbi:FecCD family ABC transporter permease [Methanorbis rubei]|uniref:Cobalamin import system permease protein BtuC n=1 Tax=Methanorbis rubei TaxID=3028300 RepID=A0AAE4MDS3_9EURY|nr:Hemin transport system permease protein HmuU [Methanocorpusculaceae archaeon Cs1]
MFHRSVVSLSLLFLTLLGSILVATCIGVSGLSIFSFDQDIMQKLILDVRLPRVLGAALVGMGLAAAGCVMQGLFRNPMADPYIIGTSSGGAIGAAAAIVFLGGLGILVFAFLGATASTVLVYSLAVRNGRVSVETLLLCGVAVSLFLSAVLSFLMYISGNSLQQIVFWTMGGLWNIHWNSVYLALLIPLACILVFFFSRDLNIMALGEEDAVHLGVNTEKTKRILLLASAFISAIAVSIAGCIGFIGLIVPHIMRTVLGPDHRTLIPGSMMAGALLLIWADTVARTLPAEVPVGIITAFFGAPFFIYLLRRRTRS